MRPRCLLVLVVRTERRIFETNQRFSISSISQSRPPCALLQQNTYTRGGTCLPPTSPAKSRWRWTSATLEETRGPNTNSLTLPTGIRGIPRQWYRSRKQTSHLRRLLRHKKRSHNIWPFPEKYLTAIEDPFTTSPHKMELHGAHSRKQFRLFCSHNAAPSSRGRKGSTKSSYMQTGLPPGKCQKAKAHRRRPKSSYGRIGLVADAAESGIRKLPSGFAGDAAAGAAGPDGCGCPSCTASGVRMREKIWQK